MYLDRINSLFSNTSIKNGVFFLGFFILFLGLGYPQLGAVINRDIPVELDDSSAYIQRGVQMAICPLQDCPALEDLRVVIEEPSSEPSAAFHRRDMFTRTLYNHIPLYSYVMSLFYESGDGTEFFNAYYLLQGVTAFVLALGIAAYLGVQFGSVPAGIGAILVAATYFAGQGLISLVPVTLGWGWILLAIALLMRLGNRALLYLVFLSFFAIGSHVIGKVFVVMLLAFYILRGDRPEKFQDWISLIVVSSMALLAFLLPSFIDRPSLGSPISLIDHANILEEIKENILRAPQIAERSTLMVGGGVPMAIISLVAALHLNGRARRDFVLLFILFGSLAFVSLFYVHPPYIADLFARTWIPFAILMTGACAYLFWVLILSVLKIAKEMTAQSLPLLSDKYILAPRCWAQLAIIFATLMMVSGFSYHLAKGGYAMLRAKVMLTHRHDFTLNDHQVKLAVRDCNKILYANKDAMLAYFATGALKCGAIYSLSFETQELEKNLQRLLPNISHAVSMNQMAQWKGWQPVGFSNPAKISFWQQNQPQAIRLRIKNSGGPATITLVGEEDQVDASILANTTTWVSFDASKIKYNQSYEIVTSTGQIELGGIRLDNTSNLYWPWDQGVTLSYHRAIPYQFTGDITWRFDTREVFPYEIEFEVIDDNSATILAKRK